MRRSVINYGGRFLQELGDLFLVLRDELGRHLLRELHGV
jgi:hypothetical protein